MPNIGDELRGKEIGKTSNRAIEKQIHVWVQCPNCLEERWVAKKSSLNPVNNRSRLCPSCAVENAKKFRINPEKAAKEGRI